MNFNQSTLKEYTDLMAQREPVPGGGSAAALCAALGVALMVKVARYSIGAKSNTRRVDNRLAVLLKSSTTMQQRLLQLTTLDAEAYGGIVASRTKGAREKKEALRFAVSVGREICRLCYRAVDMSAFLVTYGNPRLLSDVEAAVEFLMAGHSAARAMLRVNR